MWQQRVKSSTGKRSKRDINYSIIRLEGQSETIKRPAVGSGRILGPLIIGARTCRHDEWLVSLSEHDSEEKSRRHAASRGRSCQATVSPWLTRMHGMPKIIHPAWDLYFVYSSTALIFFFMIPAPTLPRMDSPFWFEDTNAWNFSTGFWNSSRWGGVIIIFICAKVGVNWITKGMIVVLQGRANISQAIVVQSCVLAESSINSELPLSCVKVSMNFWFLWFYDVWCFFFNILFYISSSIKVENLIVME